jgi:transcriptional regulator with XRE-family HTH domain
MRLKAWRELKGFTQAKVAEELGTSEIAVLRHERGLRFPPGDTQERYREITEGAVTPADWVEQWNDPECVSARASEEAARQERKKKAAAA